jgi:deoxyribodipyrimidine photolyase-related protein
VRTLALVLGDQLDAGSRLFDDLDPAKDAVWMAEVAEETEGVHKQKVALFLAAMRHFRDGLEERGFTVHYTALTADPADDRGRGLADLLSLDLAALEPERVRVVEPGDHRVATRLREVVPELEILEDGHFYLSTEDFEGWAATRKALVLEHLYRMLRKREGLLVDDGEPVGGQWNFDQDNRASFGKSGPGELPTLPRFEADATTREVLALVEARFADAPGRLTRFDRLPVTRAQALEALEDFIAHRLPHFGRYQDAMWTDEAFLYHAVLSAPLNLKLLDPRECVAAAVAAYEAGDAPIAAVEGFVRQILGWREFVRGVYHRFMPEYAERNALGCEADVPAFFWDGETEMECVRRSMENVLEHGYAHHIQRLMVLGLFAQLLGVHPYRFHDWHMRLYLDAIDWASLPNTLGMSQYGDGGVVGTKPYCATGAYISRQSNHCRSCRYDPKKAVGGDACPFTTLYWDFLDRHRERFEGNRRMGFQLRNLKRKKEGDLVAIRKQARAIQEDLAAGGRR